MTYGQLPYGGGTYGGGESSGVPQVGQVFVEVAVQDVSESRVGQLYVEVAVAPVAKIRIGEFFVEVAVKDFPRFIGRLPGAFFGQSQGITGVLGGKFSMLANIGMAFDTLDWVVVTWIGDSEDSNHPDFYDFGRDEGGFPMILRRNKPTPLHYWMAVAARNEGAILITDRDLARKVKPTPTPPPPAPLPTPPPSAPPLAGLAAKGFAMGGQFQSEGNTLIGEDLSAIKGMNALWTRIDINWAQIQAGGSGSYNWVSDNAINQAVALGLKVLGVIVYTPGWAGASATTPPDPTVYATFVRNAVAHYSALGVHAFEIWNEPNVTASWTTPNPFTYTTLLKDAYAAAKVADPTCTIVTAGLAPSVSSGGNYSPTDFLSGIYEAGGAGNFDAVGAHPYCWPAYPGDDTATWSAWYKMADASPSMRSIMVANGDSAKQIWMTEWGAPTSDVTLAVQASMVQRAFTVARTYAWAGPLFVYQHRDQGTDGGRMNTFGLVYNNFSEKPSAAAYRSI